jgi:hypothetical protein
MGISGKSHMETRKRDEKKRDLPDLRSVAGRVRRWVDSKVAEGIDRQLTADRPLQSRR